MSLVGPTGWSKEDTDTNRDLVPPLFVNRHRINDMHEHSAFIFAAIATTMVIDPQEEASLDAECRWLTKTELDELILSDARLRPEVYRYANAALKVTQQ